MYSQAILNSLHDTAWVKRFRSAKSLTNKIALLRAYNVQDQREEGIIQVIINKLDPPKPSITREDQVRKEMEFERSKGIDIQTPREEALWQAKLDEARALDLKDQRENEFKHAQDIKMAFPEFHSMIFDNEPAEPKTEEKKVEPILVASPAAGFANELTEKTTIPETTQPTGKLITEIKGLGEKSVQRLKEAGIKTEEAFYGLTYKQATEIVQSALPLQNFKDKFRKEEPKGEII